MSLLRRSSLHIFFLGAFLLSYMNPVCSAVENYNFNNQIREFSRENIKNTANVTTLLKQGKELYTKFVPIPNPVTFKETADNHVSSSSYSRDHLQSSDYGLYNYESSPPYGHGYEQQIHDTGNYGYHAFDHHSPDNYHSGYHGHHIDYHDGQHHVGYFNKNYDHTLLAKTILWPLAGLALLGAAASLISNPVLLQLGVISGRRKRRDTEEVTGPDLNVDFNKLPQNLVIIKKIYTERKKDNLRLSLNNFPAMKGISMENRKQALENVASTETSVSDSSLDIPKRSSKFTREDNFIPIPLKIKPT